VAESVPVLVTVPQLVALQPLPVTVQVTLWAVPEQKLAMKFCWLPVVKPVVAGEREIAGVQLGAGTMVTAAVADFEGSATLVATICTPGDAGTEAGAV